MSEHQRLLVRQLKGHKDSVWRVCMTPDGKYVVSGSSDMTVRITQTKDGKLFREIKMNDLKYYHAGCVTSDGKRMVFAFTRNGTIRITKIEDGSLV